MERIGQLWDTQDKYQKQNTIRDRRVLKKKSHELSCPIEPSLPKAICKFEMVGMGRGGLGLGLLCTAQRI